MSGDRYDPKGLIGEAYLIPGIGARECRSILVDWALSLPPDLPAQEALSVLVGRHAPSRPDHPMTALLCEGLIDGDGPRRRGGWRSRRES